MLLFVDFALTISLSLLTWKEVVLHFSSWYKLIQLSYQNFPNPPAIADSMPLHEVRLTLLSWVSAWFWDVFPDIWLNVSLFFVTKGHPPSQAIVEILSELLTQSLIVLFLSPPQGLLSHEEDAVELPVVGAFNLSVTPMLEAKLVLLPTDKLPVEEEISLSLIFRLASNNAAATSIPVFNYFFNIRTPFFKLCWRNLKARYAESSNSPNLKRAYKLKLVIIWKCRIF